MPPSDATARYFRNVYPILRGAHPIPLGKRLARGMTEPGQAERLAWVLGELENSAPQTILDAGCGVGTYAVALARRGHQVTAADFSERMLEATRRAARAAGVSRRVELVHCDLRHWEPRRKFRVVLCMGVVEYYTNAAQMLERLYGWADRCMLVSLSAAGVGPRAIVRRAWLGLHGVSARLYRSADLEAMLARLPEARVRTQETRWTHCAAAQCTGGLERKPAHRAAAPRPSHRRKKPCPAF